MKRMISRSPVSGIAMAHTPVGRTYHDAQRFRRGDRPLVWAHRGASAYEPENTIPAFRLAEAQGADGIECDVMLSRDGSLVVCHDERLDRLCGVPVRVAELPLGELQRLPILAGHFPSSRATIPTLAEAVASVGERMCWNVEIKVERHEDAETLARRAVEVIRSLPLEGRVLVSSFHPLALLAVRTSAPEIPTAYLREGGGRWQGAWHRVWEKLTATTAIHPDVDSVDEASVERWRKAGWAVNVWTVDDEARLRWLADLGVDGVITNRPDRALSLYLSADGTESNSMGLKPAASQEANT